MCKRIGYVDILHAYLDYMIWTIGRLKKVWLSWGCHGKCLLWETGLWGHGDFGGTRRFECGGGGGWGGGGGQRVYPGSAPLDVGKHLLLLDWYWCARTRLQGGDFATQVSRTMKLESLDFEDLGASLYTRSSLGYKSPPACSKGRCPAHVSLGLLFVASKLGLLPCMQTPPSKSVALQAGPTRT